MTIYIGLIGAGNITETHARAARAIANVEIAAVYGENSDKVHRLSRDYGATPYTDLALFLRHRPMNLVAIGSPSGLHAEQGIQAARQGLHVLTEKPIDIRTDRADALIAETDRAGVKLGVFFQDRSKSDIARLRSWLRSGKLGTPILADARVKWYRPPEYYKNSRWRGTLALDGGGALMNQGIHTVDLLLWLLGDVASVQARMKTALHAIESEDILVCLLGFKNGVLATLVATTSAYPGYPRRVEVTGSEGTVILEQDRIVRVDLRIPLPELANRHEGDHNASASSPVISDIRGHQAILEDFLCAIETGATPACDGREGRRSLAVVDAIYESARRGRCVALT